MLRAFPTDDCEAVVSELASKPPGCGRRGADVTAGARARRKGVTGERQCADVFEAAGWEVRGLEGSGDWIAWRRGLYGPAAPDEFRSRTIHVEVKRQERLRLPEWLAQAKHEAPEGVPPVVCFRQNRGEWVACLPLADLLELIG